MGREALGMERKEWKEGNMERNNGGCVGNSGFFCNFAVAMDCFSISFRRYGTFI